MVEMKKLSKVRPGLYLMRLLGLPFMLALHIIAFVFHLPKWSYQWMRWGGEMQVFGKDVNRKSLVDVYKQNEEIIREHKAYNEFLMQNVSYHADDTPSDQCQTLSGEDSES